MHTTVTPEIRAIMEAIHYRPAVSVIIPFEPKMNAKTLLLHSLKLAVTKVEKELSEKYPDEMASLVVMKLNTIIKNLNYSTDKKSIAIYVSPIFEKVLYLDLAVEERIVVDETFEIRDLVYCKKQAHKFLVLVLSAKESKMYLGNSNTCIRILSSTSLTETALNLETQERVGNFTDISSRKEIQMNKFLHLVDHSLDSILKAYPLPLFVLGTDKIIGHFKKTTGHAKAVIDYIHGNYEEASPEELQKILDPLIADWKKVEQKNLMNKLEEAAGNHKLVFGIRKVWEEAMHQKGQLLVVEKNYMYPAKDESEEELIDIGGEGYNHFSYVKDAVDDIMEKVLENGGDIEFTEEGMLTSFHHIALITYY